MSCNYNCNQGRNCTCDHGGAMLTSRWFWIGGAVSVLLWTLLVLALVR